VELYACLDERAHDGMPADAVVDMPAEIAVALHHVRILDEHHRTIEAVVADPQVGAGESGEMRKTRIEREGLQDRRKTAEVVDPRHDLATVGVDRPPRERVAGSGLRPHMLDFGSEPIDFRPAEDGLDMQVSGDPEEVAHFLDVAVVSKAAVKVEGVSHA